MSISNENTISKCPNYFICYTKAPLWVFKCNYNVCMNCAASFAGPLETIKTTEECPICFDTKEIFVKFQQCTHSVCNTCFGKCIGWYDSDNDSDNDSPTEPNGCPFCRRPYIKHW